MAGDEKLIVELHRVRKDYRGLRPLRVERLEVGEAQSIALVGFDQVAAEVLVNLITGATVPDAGDVRVFGQSTTAIPDADAWFAMLDRFGILSDRAVLLDMLTVEKNLILPFTLEVDEPDNTLRTRVYHLANDVGLAADDLGRIVAETPPLTRLRLRLGRALALNPQLLLAEHPTASLEPAEVAIFAADLARLTVTRRIASLILTADVTFAAAVAERILTLQPATGELRATSGWRRWLS